MDHWSRKYIGKQYIDGEYDCLDFVLEVLSAEYGVKTSIIPNHGSCTLDQQRQIKDRVDDYSIVMDNPVDGCAVLLKQGLRCRHLGIYYIRKKVGYIIHNSPCAKSVVQVPAYRISEHGCEIDRYLKWSKK